MCIAEGSTDFNRVSSSDASKNSAANDNKPVGRFFNSKKVGGEGGAPVTAGGATQEDEGK